MRVASIDLDRCPACDAIWFDAGELEAYRADVGTASVDLESVELSFSAPDDSAFRSCPKCEKPTLFDGTAGHYGLARCSACLGFFLSADQMTTISKSPARRYAESAVDLAISEPEVTARGAGKVLRFLMGFLDGM